MTSECGLCGEKHVERDEIRKQKEELNYSWGDLSKTLHYSKAHIRAIHYGARVISCRFSATWKAFIAIATPLPVRRHYNARDISLLQVGPELVKQRSSRRSHESGQWAVISTNRLAMKWHWFKCEHCGEWYIGVHKQKYCLKEACVKFRKNLRALPQRSVEESKPDGRKGPRLL